MILKHQLNRAVTKSDRLKDERRNRAYELHQMSDEHQKEHSKAESIIVKWAAQHGTCLSLATIA